MSNAPASTTAAPTAPTAPTAPVTPADPHAQLLAMISDEAPPEAIEAALGAPLHILLAELMGEFQFRRRYSATLIALAMKLEARATISMSGILKTENKGRYIRLYKAAQHDRCMARDHRRLSIAVLKRHEDAKSIQRPSVCEMKKAAAAAAPSAPNFYDRGYAQLQARAGSRLPSAPSTPPPTPKNRSRRATAPPAAAAPTLDKTPTIAASDAPTQSYSVSPVPTATTAPKTASTPSQPPTRVLSPNPVICCNVSLPSNREWSTWSRDDKARLLDALQRRGIPAEQQKQARRAEQARFEKGNPTRPKVPA